MKMYILFTSCLKLSPATSISKAFRDYTTRLIDKRRYSYYKMPTTQRFPQSRD